MHGLNAWNARVQIEGEIVVLEHYQVQYWRSVNMFILSKKKN